MHTRAFDASSSRLPALCDDLPRGFDASKSLYLKNHHVDTKPSVVGLQLIPSLCNQ